MGVRMFPMRTLILTPLRRCQARNHAPVQVARCDLVTAEATCVVDGEGCQWKHQLLDDRGFNLSSS